MATRKSIFTGEDDKKIVEGHLPAGYDRPQIRSVHHLSGNFSGYQ